LINDDTTKFQQIKLKKQTIKSSKKKVKNYLQKFCNKVLGCGPDSGWHMILVLFDLCVGVLERLRLEGWLADEQCVEDASDRPDVDLVAVTLLSEHLGSDVVGRATQSLLPLPVKVDPGGKTEIANFDLE
jgi:hypothetical protein